MKTPFAVFLPNLTKDNTAQHPCKTRSGVKGDPIRQSTLQVSEISYTTENSKLHSC